MKIERSKNAVRNIVFGVFQRIYTILLPFFIRTIMIHSMGVEYLGLNSLYSSILQVLNLAELGVGSAMVYSMYKPISTDDKSKICSLLNLYKTYYRIIGLIICIAGCLLCPFLPRLIAADSLNQLPAELNLYILYLLNLAATVLTYWLFAYKKSLLDAHQRTDIASKIAITTSTLMYLLQIVSIIVFKNYYLFVMSTLFTQALNNIVTSVFVSKMYPNYKAIGHLSKKERTEINKRIGDLFTSKLGGVIVGPTSTIVISTFLGLKVLAIYQNYYFILSGIAGFINIIMNSCLGGIGNSLVVESKGKNLNDLKVFTHFVEWIIGFCSVCLLCLYQPFMKIWVGAELLLDNWCVVFFVLYFYIQESNMILLIYKDAGGIWRQDKFRPLTVSVVNLIFSIILVNIAGIYGILASTFIATIIIGTPWLINNLFTTIFDRNQMAGYLKKLIYYAAVTAAICMVFYIVCDYINPENLYLEFLIKMLVCLLSNVFFFIFYFRLPEFQKLKNILKRVVGVQAQN